MRSKTERMTERCNHRLKSNVEMSAFYISLKLISLIKLAVPFTLTVYLEINC